VNPNNSISLYFFFFFLLPGLYFDFLSKRHQSQYKETSLQELGRIVIASCLLIVPSGLLSLLFFKHRFPRSLKITDILENPFRFSAENTFLFLEISFLTIFLAGLLALIADNFLIAVNKPNFSRDTTWNHFFLRTPFKRPAGFRYPFVKLFKRSIRFYRTIRYGHDSSGDLINSAALITTVDGNKHLGVAHIWSSEEHVPGREIVLAPLNQAQIKLLPPYFQNHIIKEDAWMSLSIPESAILSIELFYFKKSRGKQSKWGNIFKVKFDFLLQKMGRNN
jgi:hypothetical protein